MFSCPLRFKSEGNTSQSVQKLMKKKMCIQVFCWGFDELLKSMLWIACAGHGTLWISPFWLSPCRPFYTCTSYAFFCQTEQLNNEKRANSCLGYIYMYIWYIYDIYIYGIVLPSYVEIIINHYFKNHPSLTGKPGRICYIAESGCLRGQFGLAGNPWWRWVDLVAKMCVFFSDEVVTLPS